MRNTDEYKQIFASMEKIYLNKGIDELNRTYDNAIRMFNRSLESAIKRKLVCERNGYTHTSNGKLSYDYECALDGIEKHADNICRANSVMKDLKEKYGF